MKILGTFIYCNGFEIKVEDEHGHYKLSHVNKEQRCDAGELNVAIPDFAEILAEEMNKRKQVTA